MWVICTGDPVCRSTRYRFAEPFVYGDDARILDEVGTDMTTLGLDGMNIRLYLAGVGHTVVMEQIACFGACVEPSASWAPNASFSAVTLGAAALHRNLEKSTARRFQRMPRS